MKRTLRALTAQAIVLGSLALAASLPMLRGAEPALHPLGPLPYARQGWTWPEFASEPGISFPEIVQRLSALEPKAPSGEMPASSPWEAQMRAMLPNGAGWIGVRPSGEFAIWRTKDATMATLNFESLKRTELPGLEGTLSGVVVRDARTCAVISTPITTPLPGGLRGRTVQLIDLADGSVVAERTFEPEARIITAPSGQGFLALLPVPPTEARAMSAAGGAPPADEAAVRAASSAVRFINPSVIEGEFAFTAHVAVGCIAAGFSPHETRIWTRDPEGNIRVFDASSRRRIGPVFALPVETQVTVTDNGLLIVGLFGELRLYDGATGQLLTIVSEAHTGSIQAIALRPAGDAVATYGRDGAVRGWKVPGLERAGEWDAPPPEGRAQLGFIDDATIVAAPGEVSASQPAPTCVLAWAQAADLRRWNMGMAGAITRTVAISPAARYVASVDSADTIAFYDNRSLSLVAVRPSPVHEPSSLYFPSDELVVIAGPYEGPSGARAAVDTLKIPPSADLPATPRKRWIAVETETPHGRFSSTDTLDWICTFGGREIRGGQAGFPRGMGQPLGWIEITDTDTFAAIGWNTILLYSPKQQRVVHVYQLLSRAVHAVYDSSTRTILVAHGDGVIRRWPIPTSLMR